MLSGSRTTPRLPFPVLGIFHKANRSDISVDKHPGTNGGERGSDMQVSVASLPVEGTRPGPFRERAGRWRSGQLQHRASRMESRA